MIEIDNDPLPVSAREDLLSKFSSGKYLELEAQARELIKQFPLSGFVWKSLGTVLLVQGKPAVSELQKSAELSPADAFVFVNLGNAFLNCRKLEEAAENYQIATRIDSGFAEAYNNLGMVFTELRRLPAAIENIRRAIVIRPMFAEAHYNLGNALRDIGQLDNAIASYQQTVDIVPTFSAAYANMGHVMAMLGKNDRAIEVLQRALEISPNYPDAHNSMGIALVNLGRLDEALCSFQRATVIEPMYFAAYNNMGNVQRDLGRVDQAISSFRRAIEIEPGFANAYYNLGISLYFQGLLEDAVSSFFTALSIKPDYIDALLNLGNTFRDLGRLDQAEAYYARALVLDPNCLGAHLNQGNVLRDRGLLEDAAAAYRRALSIAPEYVDALSNLGNVQMNLGQNEDAAESYRRALEIKPDFVEAISALLMFKNYRHDVSGAELYLDAKRFGDITAATVRPYMQWNVVAEKQRRLRVGFVSADIREHSVGHFLETVLAALSVRRPRELDLFAYFNCLIEDGLTERVKGCFHEWRAVVPLSDEQLARLIYEDRIDVLIDLSGHTAHTRLSMLAWKPAPVQVSWLGYVGTTGLAEIDYIFADSWSLPGSDEPNFTEKVWRLPDSYLCFTPPKLEVPIGEPPTRRNGYITFGSFNNLPKTNDMVVSLWAKILGAVPNSRLLLKTKQLGVDSIRKSLHERFEATGIESHRIILEPAVPGRAEHLETYNRIDIGLDTFPYTGVTTTAEALWMGVPVISLAGDRFLSRQGVGLLMNAGLPDWVVTSTEEYVSRAIRFSNDVKLLESIRGRLRKQLTDSAICDAARFADNFAIAIQTMWCRWCDKRSVLDL